MAKRIVRRRRAAKPKLHDVEGHLLTEAMNADYERCLESRARTNRGDSAGRILELGLDDFLSGYRPSRKVEGQLHELCSSTTRLGLAIGTLQRYPFFTGHPGVVRVGGCDLLKKLALDLYNASAKLTAIAMNVEAEGSTKLQDWLAADARLAQIGPAQAEEVAHG